MILTALLLASLIFLFKNWDIDHDIDGDDHWLNEDDL